MKSGGRAGGANPNDPPAQAGRPFDFDSASPLALAISSATRPTFQRELTPEETVRAQERQQSIRNIAMAMIVHPEARLDELISGQSTLLHATVIAGDVELTRLLLQQDADPNIQNRSPPTRRPQPDGFTPLHHAAAAGNTELMDLLIQHDATPDIKNSLGQTPADLLREHAARKSEVLPVGR